MVIFEGGVIRNCYSLLHIVHYFHIFKTFNREIYFLSKHETIHLFKASSQHTVTTKIDLTSLFILKYQRWICTDCVLVPDSTL